MVSRLDSERVDVGNGAEADWKKQKHSDWPQTKFALSKYSKGTHSFFDHFTLAGNFNEVKNLGRRRNNGRILTLCKMSFWTHFPRLNDVVMTW